MRFFAPPVPSPALSRRRFLVLSGAAGAGLTLGLPAVRAAAQPAAAAGEAPFSAYLRIAPDNTVTVLSAHLEMGQGAYSGVATLVAEELGAAPAQIRVDGAAGNPKLYGNLAWGGAMQGTGGSTAMTSSFERYRRAGATARAMLVAAAADQWGVPAGEITVEGGVISHASGRRATFGELAESAARLPVPGEVALKDPKDWTLIGSETFRRVDSADKSTGRQAYTIDVRLPGMLTAVVAHPPRFGGTVRSFDATAAKAVKGVVDVVQISRGVAVIAEHTWAAMKGREALTVEWNLEAAEGRGSAELMAEYKRLATEPPTAVADRRGDAGAAFAGAARVVEATYEFPYLAHAALEPLDAVARRDGDVLEVWGGHQMPDLYQAMAAEIAGVSPENVRLHVMMTGGGFGRRATPDADVIVEAVECAKAIGWRAPVKVLWTREDDMAGGRYRPMYLHAVRAAIDADGNPLAWQHRIVGQSIVANTPFAALIKDGVDVTSVEGVSGTPYAIPNFTAELTTTSNGVPVLWWRSVGHTHTAYTMETMIDALARAAERDPVEYRRALLKDHPRHLRVLDLAAEKAGWSEPLTQGRFRGVAVHESFSTVVAEVAEIAVDDKGGFRVERVVCAVDCGIAINPDQIRAQMEGGIGFGLGAVLHSQITLTEGEVDQGNFDTYEVLRFSEMPRVEVHIVPSTAPPTGAGEPGVPPIGPAVANALAAAGRAVNVLPLAQGA
ncbi:MULTISPECIES: xanthine dehydrogenase family protein molybdopterin-binding subunit [unclassified Chelatococcus]|uniref:xanthine dehydrogenase family protein molybdopterin-binding subunit n=1 Tax=unclassified Chelatococcus TaxID=2638111 RepID=UPI000316DCA1|nr:MULTISPECIES: xanthine dehydrogenase family protein molybdopterin-binding subunit [unclassified Chelatococcus]ALA20327.1 twin-arginine translocation pathway signal protein [Chelatococcus sp. CO-6]